MTTLGKMLRPGIFTMAVLLTATTANAYDRNVFIRNNTSETMLSFYASNVDADDWQEDILRTGVLRPGERVKVLIDDGLGYCRYDLKAVFMDGSSAIRRRVNVCRVSSWTIND